MSDTNKKILIVDEDKFLLGIYARRLKESGWQVEYALTKEKAKEGLSDNSYDVVVLDVLIGSNPGIEVLEAFKKEGLFKDSIVIILTNDDGGENLERAKSAGVDGYIVKPHNTPEEVVGEIEKIYSNKHE